MKLAAVLLAVAAAAAGGWLARGRRRFVVPMVMLATVLPWINLDVTDIDLITYVRYRGDANGVNITAVDVLAVALFVALPLRGRLVGPYWKVRLAYLALAIVSVWGTDVPELSGFGIWKVVRAYFYLAVVARAAADPTLTPWLLNGLGAGVLVSGVVAVYQRYGLGAYQSSAYFAHQNTLGMASNLVTPIAFALVLHGKRWKVPLLVVAAGAVCVVLTLSRGGMMMMALALGGTFLFSTVRKPTWHKARVALVCVLGASLLVAKSWDTIQARFESAPRQSEMAREKFNDAASRMVGDHPFGVGLNQYSWVLDHGGYAEAAKLPAVDRDGLAHHIYWLTIAELGWLGWIAYVATLLVPLALAAHGAWVGRDDVRGDVLLGCAVALAVMYFHGTAEWVARQMPMMYLYWAVAACVWALARQVRAASAATPSH